MKITSLALHSKDGWPTLDTDVLAAGLNVFHGPSASGKSTLADLATHSIYGRRFAAEHAHETAPEGDVIVEHRGRKLRLRRSHDESAGERLTVSALDRSPVDQDTVRQLVACLSPTLLRPLFAVDFRESPRLDWLLSPKFAQEFRDALWQLKWAPPTVETNLRPIYARMRSLESKVSKLARGLETPAEQAAAVAENQVRTHRYRASHFLALLTDGELVQLRLGHSGRAQVISRHGDSLAVESLWSTQRDLVYLSLCFALSSSLRRHGVRLPLVLDEPFARLDARTSAALVDVLDTLTTRGHQVLVFTGRREVVRRFAEIGAVVRELAELRGVRAVAAAKPQAEVASERETEPAPVQRLRRVKRTRTKHREAG
jgi:energy-coupling factor transporter ATP-binding protein EcfA2